jgi:hypothetical protein
VVEQLSYPKRTSVNEIALVGIQPIIAISAFSAGPKQTFLGYNLALTDRLSLASLP